MRVKQQSAVPPLLGINVVVFIIQMIFPAFTEAFVLRQGDLFTAPWTLLTSMFMHGSFPHILFNMFVLMMFGPIIEQRIGMKRFLGIYLVSGIAAGVAASFFYTAALGASGAIMGILGVTIILIPDLQVLFFFFIPMSLRTAGIIIAAIDIFGIFVPTGVANIAHLGGLATGLAYGYYLLKAKRRFNKVVIEKPRRKKTIEMDDEDIDRYVRNGRL